MKIKEKIFDLSTGVETIIERELHVEELNQLKNEKLEEEARILAKAELDSKRQALLQKLGITEDEAKLLLS